MLGNEKQGISDIHGQVLCDMQMCKKMKHAIHHVHTKSPYKIQPFHPQIPHYHLSTNNGVQVPSRALSQPPSLRCGRRNDEPAAHSPEPPSAMPHPEHLRRAASQPDPVRGRPHRAVGREGGAVPMRRRRCHEEHSPPQRPLLAQLPP